MLYQPSPIPFRPHEASWRQPLYLHLSPLWKHLRTALRSAHGRTLDVGCGLQPYRELLPTSVTEYVGVDREGPLTTPTVLGTAEALPFSDATFDTVLSTQVLEHVTNPALALREAHRVLRSNGTLLLSVPGVWPLHEAPYDYWRFTRHGLAHLLEKTGFHQVEITCAGGLWSSVGQLVNLELQRARWARQLVPLVNLTAQWLDARGAHEELGLAWVVTAQRR